AGPRRETDKKSLIGRKAVTVWEDHIFGGVLPGDLRQNRSAEVRHVLAFRSLRITPAGKWMSFL
ncbi:MAG: hypothetical protein WB795_16600, partial [Candidatus Acidiferrales bacterium]